MLIENRLDLLSPPEAAIMLHVQECTIRKWMLKRKLGRVKLGRRVFLRRSDLIAMIDASFIPPKAEANNLPPRGSPSAVQEPLPRPVPPGRAC